MTFLTQNKKIAISAIVIFIVSFVSMVFFLDDKIYEEHGEANLLGMHNEESDAEDSQVDPEKVYRAALSDNEDPLFAVDATGKFKYVSEDFAELINVDSEELIGKLLYNYINTQDLPHIVPIYTNLFNEKERVDGVGPYRMIQNDHEIMVLFSIFPILNEVDVVEEIVFGVKDITNQVKELNKAVGAEEEEDKGDGESDWLQYVYPHLDNLSMENKKVVFNLGL